MGKVADVLLTLQCEASGNFEINHSMLVGRTISTLRGFGGPQVRCGIESYGKDLNDRPRRMSAYEKEDILATGTRCVISNRAPYGISTLKVCPFTRWEEGNETATLADFAPPKVGMGG